MSDDDGDDPFENLDAPEDREGDPFERLDDVGRDEPTDDAATGGDDEPATESPESTGPDDTDEPAFEEEFIEAEDPFESGPGTASAGGSSTNEPVAHDSFEGDNPFAGMEGREGDPFGEGESAFESVDVESVDADEVWASLDEEPETRTVEGTRYTDVSKHRFCEQCEFFSSPPNAHCTNEDAEIIEYLDMETVRLLNCPVVAEQRELEDEG